jgi:hypothetical protein
MAAQVAALPRIIIDVLSFTMIHDQSTECYIITEQ